MDFPSLVASYDVAANATTLRYATSDLVQGARYRLSMMAVDRAGSQSLPTQSGEFTIAPPLPGDIANSAELVITSLAVVEDPFRTQGCGAWTFCALMTSLAGSQDPSTFAQRFLQSFSIDQAIDGDVAPKSTRLWSLVSNAWPKGADGKYDLARAPLRLLAIVTP